MKRVLAQVLPIFVGIILTGLLLDEAGKGRAGSMVKNLAQKVTRGFGV